MPTKREIAAGLTGEANWHLENALSQIVGRLIAAYGAQWGDKGHTGVAERIYNNFQTGLILDEIQQSLVTKKNVWVRAGVNDAKIEEYRQSLG